MNYDIISLGTEKYGGISRHTLCDEQTIYRSKYERGLELRDILLYTNLPVHSGSIEYEVDGGTKFHEKRYSTVDIDLVEVVLKCFQ